MPVHEGAPTALARHSSMPETNEGDTSPRHFSRRALVEALKTCKFPFYPLIINFRTEIHKVDTDLSSRDNLVLHNSATGRGADGE